MNTDWMTGLSTEVSSLEYTDFGALSLSIKGDPIRKEEEIQFEIFSRLILLKM